ncbi:MAG: SsrA-binding protein SmpB [Acidimicrobiales bacterium]
MGGQGRGARPVNGGQSRKADPTRAAAAKVVVASNRRARHDYEILDVLETGIALVGTEVKSLRAGRVVLSDAYARVHGGELWLHGVHVAPYDQADGFGGHDPVRTRKLLAHRDEITELAERSQREGLALIPLSVYLSEGRAKVELGVGRGRSRGDKRQAIAAADARRDADRAMAARRRGGSDGRR